MFYYSKRMLKSLQKKVAIDLGSTRIRLVVLDDKLVEGTNLSVSALKNRYFEEIACVARKKKSKQFLAVGRDALSMQGRLADQVEVIFPFQASRIIDEAAAKFLLSDIFKRSLKGIFLNPVALLTTVTDISETSKQALARLLYELHFSEVYFASQSLAAAIGAGVPVAMSQGVLFLEMGSSQKEAAVIALGSVLRVKTSPFAGQQLQEYVLQFLETEYELQLSQENIRKLLWQVASFSKNKQGQLRLVGKSLATQAPVESTLQTELLAPALKRYAQDTEELLTSLLKEVSPELMNDILNKGMLVAGGWANMDGLEEYFIRHLGIPVAIVEQPELVALQGALILLASLEAYKESLGFVAA